MTLFFIVGFSILALALIAAVAVRHEPEEGWTCDPLPAMVEAAERESNPAVPEELQDTTPKLDLEI